MFNKNTDSDWEKFGKEDPYFGVLTNENYLKANLNEQHKKEFFQSGENYINATLEKIENHISPGFKVERALDFGCGVGRLVIPLAERAASVTGTDISESMLAEAEKNCAERSLSNVTLVKSDDTLSRVHGTFNFIHSYIVFQHIPVKRGEKIFLKMLSMLESGGVGVLHFTYSKENPMKKIVPVVKNYVPLAKNMINVMQGRKFFAPQMQMNSYDLNRLLRILQEHNVTELYSEYTNHGGEMGVVLFFRKP